MLSALQALSDTIAELSPVTVGIVVGGVIASVMAGAALLDRQSPAATAFHLIPAIIITNPPGPLRCAAELCGMQEPCPLQVWSSGQR